MYNATNNTDNYVHYTKVAHQTSEVTSNVKKILVHSNQQIIFVITNTQVFVYKLFNLYESTTSQAPAQIFRVAKYPATSSGPTIHDFAINATSTTIYLNIQSEIAVLNLTNFTEYTTWNQDNSTIGNLEQVANFTNADNYFIPAFFLTEDGQYIITSNSI